MKTTFTCHICHKVIEVDSTIVSGYGIDKDDNKVCYSCCGYEDRAQMMMNDKHTLYLSGNAKDGYKISNWPGTLSLRAGYVRKGGHNIAGSRYDVWFNIDGRNWHGVQYSENTQILHCRTIK